MSATLAAILAWVPFVTPLPMPAGVRMWMFPPLALCIAVVYRATRCRVDDRLLRGSLITFINIIIGMVVIALAVYGAHAFVLWMS